MADLKTITLPDNNTYNFRDARVDDLAEIKSIGTGLNLSNAGVLSATGGGGGGASYATELPLGEDATDFPAVQLGDDALTTLSYNDVTSDAIIALAGFANENRSMVDGKVDIDQYKYTSVSLTYNGSSGTLKLRRHGPIVVGVLSITCSAKTANSDLTVTGTVPSGYRPVTDTVYIPVTPVTNNSPSGSSRWSVSSAGAIHFVSSTTSAREYRSFVTWLTTDAMPS